MDTRNSDGLKTGTNEIPSRKKNGHRKFQRVKIAAKEIPKRESFGHTQFPRVKNSNQQNTHGIFFFFFFNKHTIFH